MLQVFDTEKVTGSKKRRTDDDMPTTMDSSSNPLLDLDFTCHGSYYVRLEWVRALLVRECQAQPDLLKLNLLYKTWLVGGELEASLTN